MVILEKCGWASQEEKPDTTDDRATVSEEEVFVLSEWYKVLLLRSD